LIRARCFSSIDAAAYQQILHRLFDLGDPPSVATHWRLSPGFFDWFSSCHSYIEPWSGWFRMEKQIE